MNQTTIQRVVTCSGIGLHSGKKVYLALRPASANTGIIFDIHTQDGIRRVSPTPKAVMTTALATTLGTADATVSTVEHLLASVLGLGIDNLIVSVEGGEIPIMDGSAAAFVKLFAEAGIRRLNAPRKVMRVSRPTELHDGIKHIRALPYAGFRVDYTIDFPHPAIGRQQMSMEVTPETFARVANARTFGFFKDVEYLHSHGLARGGSLESVVVLDDKGVMNPEGLRYRDEFVRHKVLDFIGDMAMLGLPIQGHFDVCCSGHQLNNAFLRKAEEERVLQLIDLSLEEARTRKPREKVPAYEGSLALA
ncbi:MAG TPA: UDP-3-O-acyl-N-acetylglucosamine deacetylase [Candidatus Bilophila faecipullorum]|uniref:UDP-3-O-acyl-N-acetylglucosamine deacetylase n=1 Tax=Candidatus Bilophila faecipullorum TaxID=2838482 RepID=A0A9D1R2A5_9BACT|nr:UDP-3-O-acyl-N-acetylglucosamine deacetylase [uncultured Bilophila sp.]HIW79148.1 UDP-3-O-acyl-N-acetylglucosamine deacetylase [Candidatus Bilophila faecipullorum]